jgi:uncharacterized protein YqjF (DUF2071 family)
MEHMPPWQLLKHTGHRTSPLPVGRWNFYQEWHRTLFLHFRVEAKELAAFVPDAVELDLFHGKAWISVVVFTMEGVRPRLLPAWSPLSNFHELNVRTYVRGPDGMNGVYFLHIAAAKAISVSVARMLSVLPYQKAEISRTSNGDVRIACSSRTGPCLHTEFTPGDMIAAPRPLDIWLTERYAVYQQHGKAIWRYQVHHVPWPLRRVRINRLQIESGKSLPLRPSDPDLAHWSEGVQVLSWPREHVVPVM